MFKLAFQVAKLKIKHKVWGTGLGHSKSHIQILILKNDLNFHPLNLLNSMVKILEVKKKIFYVSIHFAIE